MRKLVLVALPLTLVSHAAAAASAAGPSALALAALVAQDSPWLTPFQKQLMAGMLDGIEPPAVGNIVVKASKLVCRSSNVDLLSRSCSLSFGARMISLKGRRAYEIYATIAEAGVPPDGAAGSIYEALKDLSCTISPAAIRAKAGGGAACTFVPGQ